MKKTRLIAFFTLQLVSSAASSQNWLPVGQLTDFGVSTLYNDTATNSLIVGGAFKYADGKLVNGIASWDGTAWDSLAGGITNCFNYCNGPDYIVRYNGDLYASGHFTEINHITTRFAKWNGTTWDTTGFQVFWDSAGTQGVSPASISVVNNELWVCGCFYKANNMLVNNSIAKWNGANYSSFPTTAPPSVSNSPALIALPVYYNGMWYFIGDIRDSTNHNRNVVRWTGSQWEIFGGGIGGGLSEVSRMLVFQNKLYIAGTFTQADGNPENAIVTWDGSNWGAVGGGITDSGGYYGQIFDMTIYNNELWVVGNFQMAGGIYAKNIAKWNGSQWCSLGNYFDNTITSIASYNNDLYIGGGFWTIDGDSVTRIAKWTGGSYVDTCASVTGIENSDQFGNIVWVFPNPTIRNATFQFSGKEEIRTVIISDQVGRIIWERETQENQVEFSSQNVAPGVYFYRVEEEETGKAVSGKLVLL